MRMDPTDMRKYPRCTQLILTLEASLRGQARVLDAFIRACTAPDQGSNADAIARRALRWATNPVVLPRDNLHATEHGQVVQACGYQPPFTGYPGATDQLLITSVWFDALEFGTDFDRPTNANRLVRTVLHEAVHWVRQEAGASDDISGVSGLEIVGKFRGHDEEAGHMFERWAFGSANICTPDELLNALASIGPIGERQLLQSRKP